MNLKLEKVIALTILASISTSHVWIVLIVEILLLGRRDVPSRWRALKIRNNALCAGRDVCKIARVEG